MRHLTKLIVVVTLLGCGSLWNVLGIQDDLLLSFEVDRPTLPDTPQEARAETGERRIVVHGMATAPDPCRTLTATAEWSAEAVVLKVDVAPSGAEACVAAIAYFPYRAELGEFDPGEYRVIVRHTYPGTGWSTANVLDTTVIVD